MNENVARISAPTTDEGRSATRTRHNGALHRVEPTIPHFAGLAYADGQPTRAFFRLIGTLHVGTVNQGKPNGESRMERGRRCALTNGSLDRLREATEKAKAKVRARGEHAFHVVKNLFGHRKVRYRGLANNEAQLFSLFGLANLVLAQRRMPALQDRIAS